MDIVDNFVDNSRHQSLREMLRKFREAATVEDKARAFTGHFLKYAAVAEKKEPTTEDILKILAGY